MSIRKAGVIIANNMQAVSRDASTTQKGVVRFANEQELAEGTSTTTVVSVKNLRDNKPEWGNIDGDITNQEDLQDALRKAGTPDNMSIRKTQDNKLQAIGVIDSNGETKALKMWSGQRAQYDESSKDENTIYNITDDTVTGTVYTKAQSDALLELKADKTVSANTGLSNLTQSGVSVIDNRVQALAVVPTGTILPFGGTTPPEGYLICDGSAINRITYHKLFSVIGTSYGAGDGNSTFNIPSYIEEDTVIETKKPTASDYTWYRIYKSGWIEQGGRTARNVSEATITLPKTMLDTNYSLVIGIFNYSTSGTGGFNNGHGGCAVSTSVIHIDMVASSNYASTWFVSGQLADGQYPIVKETKRQIIKY